MKKHRNGGFAKLKAVFVTLFLIGTVVVVSVLVFGAYQGGGEPGKIYFSPDGSIIAHTYVKRIDLPLPPEMPTLYSTVYLQWCPADQVTSCNSIKIDSYGKSYGSFVQGQVRLLFSPDSQNLAVKSPRHLEVIELATHRRQNLTGPDELVSSMAWRGNREMVYVVHKDTGNENARMIFRHPIGEASEKRVLLFKETGISENHHDYVSPTGDFVIFFSQHPSDNSFNLLNVQTEKTTRFDGQPNQCQGVSWKLDGSCAFCVSDKKAMLMYPKDGWIKDFSDDYDRSFRRNLTYGPSIDELWTPDGGYIVINSTETGGCLVCPDPWQVVDTGKRLKRYVEGKENLRIFHEFSDGYPYLLVQPCSGWVRLRVQVILDQKPVLTGQSVALKARNYLVDYQGKQFLSMTLSGTLGGAWTLTPDGRKIVYFKDSVHLGEKSIDLPKRIHPPGP